MIANRRYPGNSIPQGKRYWFVILHGNVVRKIDLQHEYIFPELEDPDMYYVCFG